MRNGPVYNSNGNVFWYLNGKLHREEGPAIEYVKGNRKWYLYGVEYTENEHKTKMRTIIFNRNIENSLDNVEDDTVIESTDE